MRKRDTETYKGYLQKQCGCGKVGFASDYYFIFSQLPMMNDD